VTCATIPRIAFPGKIPARLQVHLALPWDCKQGSGCAFFLCHKTQRCGSLPSLHMMQLFSDDISGSLHQPEIRPVALSQGGLWHWHSAMGLTSCVIAQARLLRLRIRAQSPCMRLVQIDYKTLYHTIPRLIFLELESSLARI
jgi:hypothetical protein